MIAVIGGRTMGAGIAQAALMSGLDVLLVGWSTRHASGWPRRGAMYANAGRSTTEVGETARTAARSRWGVGFRGDRRRHHGHPAQRLEAAGGSFGPRTCASAAARARP
jgi:hypothetical protein